VRKFQFGLNANWILTI
jgi:putative transposase